MVTKVNGWKHNLLVAIWHFMTYWHMLVYKVLHMLFFSWGEDSTHEVRRQKDNCIYRDTIWPCTHTSSTHLLIWTLFFTQILANPTATCQPFWLYLFRPPFSPQTTHTHMHEKHSHLLKKTPKSCSRTMYSNIRYQPLIGVAVAAGPADGPRRPPHPQHFTFSSSFQGSRGVKVTSTTLKKWKSLYQISFWRFL